MKVTILGCGNAWAKELGNTSFLLEHKNVKLLVDCGFTVPSALSQVCSIKEVTHCFVSHIHADHVGGLEEFAHKSYFKYAHKPVLLVGTDLLPILWTNCLSGGLRNAVVPDTQQDMVMTLGSYFTIFRCTPLKWIELKDAGLYLALYATKHVGNKVNYSLLVRDHEASKQVLFTCDVVSGNKLPYKASDLIFHDCSFTPKHKSTVHTHIEELLLLPLGIQEKLVAVHYEDDVPEKRPLIDLDVTPIRIAATGDQYEL